jgi:hypothetical protein
LVPAEHPRYHGVLASHGSAIDAQLLDGFDFVASGRDSAAPNHGHVGAHSAHDFGPTASCTPPRPGKARSASRTSGLAA